MTLSTMSALALACAIAYLFGSIPTGYLAGRLLRGIDIREHGSGSTGATNVLRTLGKLPALVVLLVDVLKGAAAVVTTHWILGMSSIESSNSAVPAPWLAWVVAAAGLFAILGHARSMWLRFSGGKSAATGLGVLLAISWPIGLGAAATFVLVVAATRIVSLSSMLGALAAFVVALGTEQPTPYLLLAVAGGAYVIVRHRANIKRLIRGTEPRIGQSRVTEQRE